MKLAAGHLTYCSNIHAGESWVDHFESLKEKFPLIKSEVSGDQPLGLGLRLSNRASKDLQDKEKLQDFQLWLKENDAYVFTMNGFPYGDFHHAVVKDQVHAPDWTSTDRLEYTIRLFEILAELLPEDMDGGVSTSPLSYRFWFSTEADSQKAMHQATGNIISVLEHLFLVKKNRGVIMHLDIEPEPDGMLETGREFIDWYQNMLIPQALKQLKAKHSLNKEDALDVIREHICLCYDVCHFAIGYEPHQKVLDELRSNKISVGKIQISAALKSDLTSDPATRNHIADAFSGFVEPTYLHQVVARKKNGELLRYRDLPEALSHIQNPEVEEWRAHFHVPVFLEDLGLLMATQSDIIEVLKIQAASPCTNHLEVETYTWEVLPESLKAPIEQSISRELNWVKGILEPRTKNQEPRHPQNAQRGK